jgi:hypothetical protein
MEFGREHEPIVEYSNLALANIINNKRLSVFCACIEQLDKKKQKMLRTRCEFLLDNELSCVPLNKEILERSYLLLQEFSSQHNVKEDFRNSWNDLLILATALTQKANLFSKDKELNNFMEDRGYAVPIRRVNEFVNLSFSKVDAPIQRVSRESKGYINRGWRAKFHHYK